MSLLPDPVHLASIHAEAFDVPWNSQSLGELLASPGVFAVVEAEGFILIRAVAEEAEILTVAVRPSARRCGLGARLLEKAMVRAIALGVEEMFLEVAVTNSAAIGLYSRAGFTKTGLRRGYYAKNDGLTEDALVLSRKFSEYLP